MANELYDYFVKAEKLGGVKARTRLSFLTQTSSLQAKSLIDSEENKKLFNSAFKELSREFDSTPEPLNLKKVNSSCGEVTIQLRKMIHSFVDLVAQRALFINDYNATLERITETIAYTLDLERASIWFIDNEKGVLVCKDLFIQSKKEHSNNTKIKIKDYPNYFNTLAEERTMPAHDVSKDERTAELLDSYLNPLDIKSMMDVPIWSRGKMIGVICHEQVGEKRKWTSDEENFRIPDEYICIYGGGKSSIEITS